MPRYWLALAFVGAFGAQPAPPSVDADALMRDVRTLAAMEMAGRATGTDGNRRARQFIVERYGAVGLEPAGTGFVQTFRVVRSTGRGGQRRASPAAPPSLEGANIIGRVRGTEAGAKSIVVSAHYDHLGVVNGVVYPGADDNASGIAAMLAVAAYARAHPPRHPLIFAAFDAEEIGLQGAAAFVKDPPVPLPSIALDVNFDMVSRNDRNEIFAAGTSHYPWLLRSLDEVRRRSAVTLRFGHDRPAAKGTGEDDWTPQSDHAAFHKAGVPFVYFGVEDHPDYHRATDTAEKIDPAFFARVVEMLVDSVRALDTGLP